MANTLTRRQRGCRLLLKTLPGPQAVSAEAAVAAYVIACKIPGDYEAKIRQIAFNLTKTPGLRAIPASKLVHLSDTTMAAGTDIETWKREFDKQLMTEDALVNRKAEVGGANLIKCRKCKSSDITTTQVQTRGADEAMTVFCECNDCGMRWKC